jgi:hypothetical protein
MNKYLIVVQTIDLNKNMVSCKVQFIFLNSLLEAQGYAARKERLAPKSDSAQVIALAYEVDKIPIVNLDK